MPQRPLLPKDPFKKAEILAFCEMINSGIHPQVAIRLQKKIEELGQDKVKWVKYWMDNGYEALENYLEGKRGQYCFGDEITLADAFFVPMTESGISKFGLDIDKFPASKKLLENLRQVPEVRESYPTDYTLSQLKPNK